MKLYKEKKNNLIVLIAFAASFSLVIAVCLGIGDRTELVSAAGFSSENVVAAIAEDVDNAMIEVSSYIPEEETDTQLVEVEEAASELTLTPFTVNAYAESIPMYASTTVNVRTGAGTDYQKVGKVSWGTPVTVTGVTDNGWFEVNYKDSTAYIKGDYLMDRIPGVPYLFVGDSRTVQLQQAVGSTDKAFIAKVGEGYSYFKDTAIPAITNNAGYGTAMIINFGVNDLSNASKYVKLVNDNIDSWISAGMTVYYSSVTPVGSSASVTNSQIESFNSTLQNGLDSRVIWIDSYSYLKQTGFSSNDGLHYSLDTYRNLYAYYMSVIAQ
jgi:hypothetical protein